MDAHSDLPARQELLAHARFVRGLAGHLVGNSAEADDIAQEALLAGLEASRRPRAVRAWLAGTVRRLFRMRVRSETRRRKRELTMRPPPSSDPAQVLAQMEVQRRLVDAVLALREPYRSTIVHRYFHDLTPAEIAGLIGVPTDTVRTRLARAHAHLRDRLDQVHSTREAWAAPLLCFTDPVPGKGSAALVTGGLLVSTKTIAVVALSILIAASLGFWLGTETAAPRGPSPEPGPSPLGAAASNTARATTEPGLEGREPALTGAEPHGKDRTSSTAGGAADPKPAPAERDAKPASAPAEPGVPKNTLDDVDWNRWIPVLAKYGALGREDTPTDELWKELESFLTDVSPRLKGRTWEEAEDLLSMPDVASRITLAAAEHFGARLTPEQRTTLRAEIEKAASEVLGGTKDALKIDRMAGTLEAVARVYRQLEPTVGAEQASSVAGFLSDLLLNRGWGTLALGTMDAAEFEAVALQLYGMRATLESPELADTSRLVRDWWERAGGVLRDLVRAHGTDSLRASVLAAADDDERTARARAAPAFAGIRSLVWAALIREQAAADHAFHDLWKRLPEDRRKAFERAEPALLLFWPTGS